MSGCNHFIDRFPDAGHVQLDKPGDMMLAPADFKDVNGRQPRFRELLDSVRCHMGHLWVGRVDGCESGDGGRIDLVITGGFLEVYGGWVLR